jgi:hypothetical protein
MGRTEGNPQQVSSRLHSHFEIAFVGDGHTKEFFLTKTLGRLQDITVQVAGVRQKQADRGTPNDYSVRGLTPGYTGSANAIKFVVAPPNLADILVDVVST